MGGWIREEEEATIVSHSPMTKAAGHTSPPNKTKAGSSTTHRTWSACSLYPTWVGGMPKVEEMEVGYGGGCVWVVVDDGAS